MKTREYAELDMHGKRGDRTKVLQPISEGHSGDSQLSVWRHVRASTSCHCRAKRAYIGPTEACLSARYVRVVVADAEGYLGRHAIVRADTGR